MTQITPIVPLRPAVLTLSGRSLTVVREILGGSRPHKDLKEAFDWENTPEGHRYWSRVRQAPRLSSEAVNKLTLAVQRSQTHARAA